MRIVVVSFHRSAWILITSVVPSSLASAGEWPEATSPYNGRSRSAISFAPTATAFVASQGGMDVPSNYDAVVLGAGIYGTKVALEQRLTSR